MCIVGSMPVILFFTLGPIIVSFFSITTDYM